MKQLTYSLVRKMLFTMDAERSHHLTFGLLTRLQRFGLLSLVAQKTPLMPVSAMGINFINPVGLAAGLDKNGECIDAFAAMGFGFIEVGTVTPRPQDGNPLPRIFRIPEQQAIINRLGFNNKGVDNLIENVKKSRYRGVLGINIGKNFDTPVDSADNDYLVCLKKVYSYASYITINISSPNTPNLRKLQFGDALLQLLHKLKEAQLRLQAQHGRYVPIAIKVAPDLSDDEISSLASTFNQLHVDGVIATNTTAGREGVEHHAISQEGGGLSGAPVSAKSDKVIQLLRQELDASIPIIGVGGIVDECSAKSKVDAGAELLQLYTGFIYQGPGLISRAVKAFER